MLWNTGISLSKTFFLPPTTIHSPASRDSLRLPNTGASKNSTPRAWNAVASRSEVCGGAHAIARAFQIKSKTATQQNIVVYEQNISRGHFSIITWARVKRDSVCSSSCTIHMIPHHSLNRKLKL